MKVILLDSMGNDLSVVNAARVSFHKVSEEFNDKDERLIKYLADHGHWTPFSQVQYQVRIKAPVFIARQWFKHQIGITRNEVSRRYVSDAPEFYTPEVWRGAPVDGAKQGSHGVVDINPGDPKWMVDDVQRLYAKAEWTYNQLLHKGVCPEQARMVLPQSMFTEWVESGSIAAAARICKQRRDAHAQHEIQVLADMFAQEVADIAPISWKALT